jgi:aminoglycoside phosphotransferase (APT) family kinase protein
VTGDDEFAARFARWLSVRRGSDVQVDEVEHPSVGYSSATTMLRAQWNADGRVQEARLVVRMAPTPAGTFADYDLAVQHAAQVVAADAGVPIAAPLETETDRSWLGAPFTVMPRVDGHIIGEAHPFDDWLVGLGAARQATLHDRFLASLVAIHRADADAAVAAGVPERDDDAELAWCRAHAPRRSDPPVVLRWGDVRLGNIVFGDDLAPRAILDWDMAAVGVPEHDVAWFTMLDFVITTFAQRRVDGFPDRAGLIARYEALAPHALEHLDWYETLALVRSTAILARIGYLTRSAGREPAMPVEGSPLLDLLRERTSSP